MSRRKLLPALILALVTGTAGVVGTWSIGQKTAWAKSKGLLGAMICEMSGDTSGGTLMSAVSSGLS